MLFLKVYSIQISVQVHILNFNIGPKIVSGKYKRLLCPGILQITVNVVLPYSGILLNTQLTFFLVLPGIPPNPQLTLFYHFLVIPPNPQLTLFYHFLVSLQQQKRLKLFYQFLVSLQTHSQRCFTMTWYPSKHKINVVLP